MYTAARAEIGKLYGLVLDEYILRFDVPMENAFATVNGKYECMYSTPFMIW
jgi:hypothetical protein